MTLALIRDGAVAELRDIALDDVPEHKRYLWRVVTGDAPADLSLYTGPTYTITETEAQQVWTPRDLAAVKAEIKAKIDADAEASRLNYITPGAGQAMTYREKFDQAEAVDAMGEQAANALTVQERVAQFPVLAASVGIEAQTLWDCAQLVLTKYQEWAMLAYQIEALRLAGKAAVDAAGDVEAARAASVIAWP